MLCPSFYQRKEGRYNLTFKNLVGRDKRRQKTRPAAPIPYVQILSLVHVYALRPFFTAAQTARGNGPTPTCPNEPGKVSRQPIFLDEWDGADIPRKGWLQPQAHPENGAVPADPYST